jgi:hypothetical protein
MRTEAVRPAYIPLARCRAPTLQTDARNFRAAQVPIPGLSPRSHRRDCDPHFASLRAMVSLIVSGRYSRRRLQISGNCTRDGYCVFLCVAVSEPNGSSPRLSRASSNRPARSSKKRTKSRQWMSASSPDLDLNRGGTGRTSFPIIVPCGAASGSCGCRRTASCATA